MLELNDPRNKECQWSTVGYLSSVVLIFLAFFLAIKIPFKQWSLILTIMSIAFVQCFIQLFTFMKLGLENKPRWAFLTALFTILVLVIIFGGSLWIMRNLNYNLMP